MAISVTKPSINLREKLNELDFDRVPFQKMPAGSVIQVVTRTFSTAYTTTSTDYQDTDCYVDITPTSTSNKILIVGSLIGYSSSTGVSAYYKLFRDSSELSVFHRYENAFLFDVCPNELDSPSSTSAIRYMMKIKAQTGNTVGVNIGSGTGNMTALEIVG